jgi:hypothetical protein
MTTTSSPAFAGSATTITITLASLANSTADPPVGRESTAIDLATIDGIDVLIGGKITVGTTPTANTSIRVYFAPSHDGTLYAGTAAGTGDAGLTPSAVELMRLAAVIPVKSATSNVVFNWEASVLEVCGHIPAKLVVFVTNGSGVALNATAGNHTMSYRAVNYESV